MSPEGTRVARSARAIRVRDSVFYANRWRKVRAVTTIGDGRLIHLTGIKEPLRVPLDEMFEVSR